MKIDREDMLELTRRMTVSRNCFTRIAGAYLDEEGFIDGTFNTNFLKLSSSEKTKKLEVAKAIPFSETNVQLEDHRLGAEARKPGSVWQLLMALRECELKNDALLLSLYELIGERHSSDHPYGIYVFYGNYDIPVKGKDKVSQWESEEVYRFLICAVCPVSGEYEAGKPECGFLFPAFSNRSTDLDGVCLYAVNGEHGEMASLFA